MAADSEATQFVLDPEQVKLLSELNFDILATQFNNYRKTLQGHLSPSTFKILNDQLDAVEKDLNEKLTLIPLAKKAVTSLRFQLYDIESEYYKNPTGLSIIDENLSKTSTTPSMAVGSASSIPSLTSAPLSSSLLQGSVSPVISSVLNHSMTNPLIGSNLNLVKNDGMGPVSLTNTPSNGFQSRAIRPPSGFLHQDENQSLLSSTFNGMALSSEIPAIQTSQYSPFNSGGSSSLFSSVTSSPIGRSTMSPMTSRIPGSAVTNSSTSNNGFLGSGNNESIITPIGSKTSNFVNSSPVVGSNTPNSSTSVVTSNSNANSSNINNNNNNNNSATTTPEKTLEKEVSSPEETPASPTIENKKTSTNSSPLSTTLFSSPVASKSETVNSTPTKIDYASVASKPPPGSENNKGWKKNDITDTVERKKMKEAILKGSSNSMPEVSVKRYVPPDEVRYIVARSKTKISSNNAKYLEKLTAELNSKMKIVKYCSMTRKGNIRLTLLPGVSYNTVVDLKVLPATLDLIDASDWQYITAHGIPRTNEKDKPYSIAELRAELEEKNIILARDPEWMDHHKDKGILKLTFTDYKYRDACYFMRAIYLHGYRAKLRFYPDEWHNNKKSVDHAKKFKHGLALSKLRKQQSTVRFFQANCSFDLQYNHDILDEMVFQAHFVCIQDCWIYNDGRPIERVEWYHHYEDHYYENGGCRTVLYATNELEDTPEALVLNTEKNFISVNFIADFVLIQVDRPSGFDPKTFYNGLKEMIKANADKPIIIAGSFNMQHKMWDNSLAQPEVYAEQIALLLEEYNFERLSPFPSLHVDSDGYYVNPSLLFAQVTISPRITVNNLSIELSDGLEKNIKDYHRLSWDLKLIAPYA